MTTNCSNVHSKEYPIDHFIVTVLESVFAHDNIFWMNKLFIEDLSPNHNPGSSRNLKNSLIFNPTH